MKLVVIENPKKKLYEELAVAFLGFIILVSSLLIVEAQVAKRVAAIGEMRQRANLVAAQVQALSTLIKQQSEMEAYIPKMRLLLPEHERIITFDQELKALGRKAGVAPGFQFGAEAAPSGDSPGKVGFHLTLQGEFSQIAEYMRQLYALNYFITFPGIDLARNSGSYSLQLEGTVFTR